MADMKLKTVDSNMSDSLLNESVLENRWRKKKGQPRKT